MERRPISSRARGRGCPPNPELWWTNTEPGWDAGSSWMSAGDFDGDGTADVARIAWMPAEQAIGVWVLRSDGHQLADGGVWGKWQPPGVTGILDVRTVNRVG